MEAAKLVAKSVERVVDSSKVCLLSLILALRFQEQLFYLDRVQLGQYDDQIKTFNFMNIIKTICFSSR